MIKFLRYSVFFLVWLCFIPKSFAQFPYVESFRAATAPGITFGGAPAAFLTASGNSSLGGTPIDPVGNGYLRLTSAANNQKGYAYSTSNFPSSKGLRVEFEYYIYGGTGADGISFFLFDATANPFVIGGFGGSLGYAQITTTTPVSPGVSKGYLAIGLDEFGNFSNTNEGRQGPGIGQVAGSITLRGKGDGAALTPDNYTYLTSKRSSDLGIDLVGNGSERMPDSTNVGYRRVLMELEPNPSGGYFITVKLTQGGTPPLMPVTIIDRFPYAEIAPANLRYGFASSTGDQTNFHEVRNVAISVFDEGSLVAPTANNDTQAACPGNQSSTNVFANDITTNTNAVIEPSTIDLNPALAGFQKTFTIAGKGTFTANDNGTVTFVPLSSFTGTVAADYTIKDNYGKTSTVATVTFNYIAAGITADAGPDAVINYLGLPLSFTLAGNDPGIGNTGAWTQISGPSVATFANNTLYNTTAGNLVGGAYVFRWTITTAGSCQSFDDVTVLVNRPPVAANDEVSTNLETDIAIHILDNDSDPDGNLTIVKSSVVITAQPARGTLVLDAVTGDVIYRPNAGFIGNDSFVYTIKDIYGVVSNQAIVNIHVVLTPIGLNDVATTPTNIPVTIPVLDNDPGKTGATVLPDLLPTHGTSVINPDGTIFYTPTPGYSGLDSLKYVIRSSSNVNSAPITVLINVKPVGAADQATTTVNIPVLNKDIKANDLSKANTTVIPKSNPANGTIGINPDGTINYTPFPGFIGKDFFNYALLTADGVQSDNILFTITVKPVGSNDVSSTVSNVPVTILVKENDLSGPVTNVSLLSPPANGTVVLNGAGNPVYTPTPGFSGTDSFTYTLKTPDGLTESDAIMVNINVRPAGSQDGALTTTNVPLTILVKDNDISKTGTTITPGTPPANGTVTYNAAGNPVYTPATGYSGKDTFTYLLKNGALFSDPITVNIDVKPVGSADVKTTPINVPVTILAKDNDLSKIGTQLSLATTPSASKGTAVVNADGNIVFTPAANFSGEAVFTYILTTTLDGLVSDPITVTVTVKPIGADDYKSTNTNVAITIPVKDNDVSSAGTTILFADMPTHGSVVLNGSGIPLYTPANGYSGKDSFTYRLQTADLVNSDLITVNIDVIPVGSPNTANTTTNNPIAIPVKTNDLSQTGTSIVLTSNPPNGTLEFNTAGEVVYTPLPGYSGIDKFTYKLRTTLDGLESEPIEVTVTVKPTGITDPVTVNSNATLVPIPVKNNDPGATGTTVSINTPPLHGTVTIGADGIPVYTPTPGYSGPDSFTYRLTTVPDGVVSDPITVNITVRPSVVIPAPPLTVSTPINTPIAVPGIPLPTGGTVTFPTLPLHGTVVFNPVTGVVTYTPAPGYTGPDEFFYVITDPDGNTSAPARVTVTVTTPAKIGLAKQLSAGPVKNADGTYTMTYTFTLVNIGDVAVDRVSLTDNLATTFGGNAVTVTRLNASGPLRVNNNYNGTSVTELLLNTSSMAAKSKETVVLEVNVRLDKKDGTFYNSGFVEAYSVTDGSRTSDLSTNGVNPDPITAGDFSSSEFTPVKLVLQDIFIPKGFSPNNDGINDFFVIENGGGKVIALEVYNRWGNLVHRNKTYANTWNGKTTEGIHMGDDVPDGTYYYIITIDGQDRRVGYITIKR
ncbi:Ig-like domain-containing protein [Pedobacter sp. MC2016-14]|uniref:Ig-like domain-containing protein n=1 Tax=Pedobacter sp. MC2016-14 TaxID=2897327 RepID=UPI001E5360E1|nr:Ig-like domain-containing protein [Pedobacter sp. MC2016-14]MCD0490223.1 Ig-like domain-containing protein [Pedobacter sp. MC2016-14]